jgi:cytochrome c oxidase assembly protein subunit 15
MLRAFTILARVAMLLALTVVVLGAWVRATDAGLGCPDWPTCYGRLVVSKQLADNPRIQREYAGRPVNTHKAWHEMIHRYIASTLGLLCVALAVLAWLNRRDPEQPLRLPLVLLALVIFQGLLGMWTVTLLLTPIIVVAHLLGGMATLGILFWLSRWRNRPVPGSASGLKTAGLAAGAVLVAQIALGGWTSANYAATACPDFPTCQTQWWPQTADFKDAFVLWRNVKVDYEGGVLDHPARVAIHFTHRLGALLSLIVLGLLGGLLLRRRSARADGAALLIALAVQIGLGISIVELGVPLAVAVAHNGMAALLLLTVINANQRIWHH